MYHSLPVPPEPIKHSLVPMDGDLISRVRKAHLSLQVQAAKMSESCPPPQGDELVTIEMFRAAAQLLYQAQASGDERRVRQRLVAFIEDFRQAAHIRRAQLALAPGEPTWLLRGKPSVAGYSREIELYINLAQHLESYVLDDQRTDVDVADLLSISARQRMRAPHA